MPCRSDGRQGYVTTQHKKTMQVAKCELIIGGTAPVLNSVVKEGVTPAEVIVLRALHGADAVRNIKVYKTDRRSHSEEYARLRDLYNEPFDPNSEERIFEKIFPASPMIKLPVSFKDIGVDVYADGPEGAVAPESEDEDEE